MKMVEWYLKNIRIAGDTTVARMKTGVHRGVNPRQLNQSQPVRSAKRSALIWPPIFLDRSWWLSVAYGDDRFLHRRRGIRTAAAFMF
jgi:hypothetical protein